MEWLQSSLLEWNGSVLCLKERTDPLHFLFGESKIERNRSVSCLVEESYGYGHLRKGSSNLYLHMVGVMVMMERNNEIIFIPPSSTQISKIVDSNIFLFSSLQVISNLPTNPIKLKMII
jgi:hypothetical protein